MKNLFDIKDKVIVITGGCGILGKNIANYLAEQGAKIVILDRVEEAGRELEAELNRKSEALFLVTDVLNKEVLEENKKAILERFGTIDVLQNAAGGNMPGATIAPDKTVLDLDVDAFRKVVDLNLFGTVLPTMVFVDVMAKNKKGAIVNFCSESAVQHRECPGHEAGSITDEVVDGSEQFFRFGKASARSLGDDGLCTVCVRTVGVGEQRTVLVGEQESRNNGVHEIGRASCRERVC